MFKNNVNVSKKKRFLVSSFFLVVSGSALFICSAFLYPQFIELVKALTSTSSASIWFYGLGWFVTLLVGILWLCFLLLFEVAKGELVTLTRR